MELLTEGKRRKLPRRRPISKLPLTLCPRTAVKVRDLGALPHPINNHIKSLELVDLQTLRDIRIQEEKTNFAGNLQSMKRAAEEQQHQIERIRKRSLTLTQHADAQESTSLDNHPNAKAVTPPPSPPPRILIAAPVLLSPIEQDSDHKSHESQKHSLRSAPHQNLHLLLESKEVSENHLNNILEDRIEGDSYFVVE